jgi:hypothetical protein
MSFGANEGSGADERRCTRKCRPSSPGADVIALNTDGEIRAARVLTAGR